MKDEPTVRRALLHLDEIATVKKHPLDEMMLKVVTDFLHWVLDEPNRFDEAMADLDAVDHSRPVN